MENVNAIFVPLDIGTGHLRVAVKDCIDIAGIPTCGGSAALADAAPATHNAVIVDRLLAGSCHIIGKANMHELAYGVTGINAWAGTPLNPFFPDYVPGGSSSGSASAVAAGLVDFTIGSDTGGSIRTPAACCGVFGLKTSFGRINRQGAWPASTTLDVLGPIAATMEGVEAAMEIIAPYYKRHADFTPRIGLVRIDEDVDAPVQEAFTQALARWGEPDGMVELPLLQAAFTANMVVIAAETYAAFGHLLATGKVGADVAARLEAAGKITQDQLAEAEEIRVGFRRQVDDALARYDVLALPTMPCFPLRLDEVGDAAAALRMTGLVRQFNLSGHPALTIPVRAANGLPVGVQLVGPIGADEMLCAAGRFLADKITVMDHADAPQ